MVEKDIKSEIGACLNETFLVQLIFGAAMVIIPLIYLLTPPIVFDFNLIVSIISGALLIVYSFRTYQIKTDLLKRLEKSEKDIHLKVNMRLNETLIVQLIFGAAMVIIPLIYLLTPPIVFDFNLIVSIISGALLIIYSFRTYRIRINLVDRIQKN